MRDLKLQELSARVVAWHNRHPLARRITAAHVHSVGYVVLPYLGPGPVAAPAAEAQATGSAQADAHGGATLRERAMARAQGTADAPAPAAAVASAAGAAPPAPQGSTLTPAFTEDFIAPLTPTAVGRWAAQHGLALATARTDAPVRQVAPGGPVDAARLQPLWLLTAQLEVGRARTRLLVGAADNGQPAAVLGRRMWSPVRIGTLLALPVLLAAVVAAAWVLRSGAPVPTATPAPGAAASAAASAASASASASTPTSPAASAAEVPSVATSASAAEPVRPIDVEPTLGRVALPPIGPRADERRRAADQAREQAVAASAAAAAAAPAALPDAAPKPTAATPMLPSPSASPALSPAPAPSPKPSPTASTGPAFAVSTRVLRTRTESEQVAAAMRALLVTAAAPGSPTMHVDVMPAGEDWRVVGWPFADRALAEKARALLATRGMKVQVIDF